LTALREASWAQAPAMKELLDALVYLLAALEAIVTLHPPEPAPPLYPRPTFVAHRPLALTNVIRTFAGMLLGFVIWDVTAWSHGAVFMVNIAIALVIFVALEDPLFANLANIIGTGTGCLVGLTAKYLLLIRGNDPLNLLIVLFPLVFLGAWIETKGKLGPFGLFFVVGLLVMIEPKNPQQYDFIYDVNVFVATVFAYGFVSLIFLAIGTPRKGIERVAELLSRMRKHRPHGRFWSSRQERLGWETWMYDELQRLQAATKDPRHRQLGVKLLLSGLKARRTFASAPAGLDGN
jgi:uncharacterized membrane protein YccC